MPLPPNYSDTGIFQELGVELAILRVFRAVWRYCFLIDPAAVTFFNDRLNDCYINTGGAYSEQAGWEDEVETLSKASLKGNILNGVAALHEQRKRDFEEYWLPYLGKILELDETRVSEGMITYEYDDDLISETGQVTIIRYGGVFGALQRQMVGDAQTIRTNIVTIGALTARATNQGQLSEVSVGGSLYSALPAGQLVIRCTDETVGRTQLTIEHRLTEPMIDGTDVILCDNPATPEASFADGPTSFLWTPLYVALLEAGDGGNIVSAPTWTNPAEIDSEHGKLYIRITRQNLLASANPPSFLVEWFKSNELTTENLVASRGVEIIAGSVVVNLSGAESTLSFTFNATNAAAALPAVGNADSDITLDLRVPRLNDEWTKAVTNDEAGLFASKLMRTWRVGLPIATNPSQTITDTLANNIAIS